VPACAPRLAGTPGAVRTPAPKLGQHNRELLGEVGVDAAKYDALLKAGAVYEEGTAPPAAVAEADA